MPFRPPVHQSRYQPGVVDARPSAHRRGYGRGHDRWREQILANHPVCRRCEFSGRTVQATIGHHLIEVTARPDLARVIENGVGVCVDCHNQLHHGVAGDVERFAEQMRRIGYGVG